MNERMNVSIFWQHGGEVVSPVASDLVSSSNPNSDLFLCSLHIFSFLLSFFFLYLNAVLPHIVKSKYVTVVTLNWLWVSACAALCLFTLALWWTGSLSTLHSTSLPLSARSCSSPLWPSTGYGEFRKWIYGWTRKFPFFFFYVINVSI